MKELDIKSQADMPAHDQVSPPLSNCSQRFGCLGSPVINLIGLYLLKLMYLSYKTKQTAKALPW